MQNRGLSACIGLAIGGVAVASAGCQQSSHASVSTYEYSEEGRAVRPDHAHEVMHEPSPSEYHMAAPGQMAAPGEMVPPGRSVVEPRRNP